MERLNAYIFISPYHYLRLKSTISTGRCAEELHQGIRLIQPSHCSFLSPNEKVQRM